MGAENKKNFSQITDNLNQSSLLLIKLLIAATSWIVAVVYFHTSVWVTWVRAQTHSCETAQCLVTVTVTDQTHSPVNCGGGSFELIIIRLVWCQMLNVKCFDWISEAFNFINGFHRGSLGSAGPEGEVVPMSSMSRFLKLFDLKHSSVQPKKLITFEFIPVLLIHENPLLLLLLPTLLTPQVQIKGDGENAWRVSAKVANTMNCKVKIKMIMNTKDTMNTIYTLNMTFTPLTRWTARLPSLGRRSQQDQSWAPRWCLCPGLRYLFFTSYYLLTYWLFSLYKNKSHS